MTPGVLQGVPDDHSLEKHMERQMGCMAGFLQLFDRQQILAGKRIYSTKRLTPSSSFDSASERSVGSPAFSSELQPQTPLPTVEFKKPAIGAVARDPKRSPSPEIRSPLPDVLSPADIPARTPLPLPVFEFKEGSRSSWKLREAPRLSLDSRAVVDGKGSVYPREIRTMVPAQSAAAIEEENNDKQRRSPSVVARLMGLEALPDSVREPLKKAELRRSASESRASREMRFVDSDTFQIKQPPLPHSNSGTFHRSAIQENAVLEERFSSKSLRTPELRPHGPKASPWNLKKSFFDSQDFFPEPKRTGSICGEIEKRLKMRGIDEPAKDLETLKQILEALQLKGLLHSKKSDDLQMGCRQRNFVYDGRQFGESPIVVMKPSRSPMRSGRNGNESLLSIPRPKPAIKRNLVQEPSPSSRVRRDRAELERNLQNERRTRIGRNADANESGSAKSPSSLARRRAMSRDTSPQMKGKDVATNSVKIGGKKIGSDQSSSPRNRKQTSAAQMEDESSTVSESSISASSQIDSERMKADEYKEGRSLLERCDRLLHSIAEMTNVAEQQPSPVSVLDSSFYKEDSSPSPVMKRCVDFKDHQVTENEEDQWSPAISPIRSEPNGGSDDQDFLYISEILKSHSRGAYQDCDLFTLLEKHHCSFRVSRLHRRVIFEAVTEILDRKRQVSPWKAFCRSRSPVIVVDGPALLRQVWSELQRVRERTPLDEGDLCNVINGVVGRDMAGEGTEEGWDVRSMEMSEVVLDIERLIFKDLVGETIRDLAGFAGKCTAPAPRRKLVF